MSKRDWTDEVRAAYPTKPAREAADRAIDALPDTDSMERHMAVWIDTYRAHGGLRGNGGRW